MKLDVETLADVGMDNLVMTTGYDLESLQIRFGSRFRTDAKLARYTTAQVGGRADGLLVAETVDDLVAMAVYLWELRLPFFVLGGGSNILISDAGVRGVVILNKARLVKFDAEPEPPTVWVASGSNFGVVARQAAARGFGGLEWAAGIPGTVGGAVIGNAGAHGSEISSNLLLADILHREIRNKSYEIGRKSDSMVKRENWSVEKLEYSYRGSTLKRDSTLVRSSPVRSSARTQPDSIVLAALLQLSRSSPESTQSKIDEYVAYRRRTQPPGATMGSMFKNPLQDFAGRLIEEAGLKGTRIGGAGISPLHGNFFINYGNASASDIWELIRLARATVAEKFGITLDLEIQLAGEWDLESIS